MHFRSHHASLNTAILYLKSRIKIDNYKCYMHKLYLSIYFEMANSKITPNILYKKKKGNTAMGYPGGRLINLGHAINLELRRA